MANLPGNSSNIQNLAVTENAGFWSGSSAYEGKLGPWSTLTLDGAIVPGVGSYDDPAACAVEIVGGKGSGSGKGRDGKIAGSKHRVDHQKVRGKSGQKSVVGGYEPARFEAHVKIWRGAQWTAFTRWFVDIDPKLTGNLTRSRTIEHPILAAWRINSVYLREVHFPADAESRFIKVVRLVFEEVYDLKTDKAKAVTSVNLPDPKVAQPLQGIGADQPPGTVYTEPLHP